MNVARSDSFECRDGAESGASPKHQEHENLAASAGRELNELNVGWVRCMGDEAAVIRNFLEIVDRLGLSDTEAAVFAGVAPHTVRVARLAPKAPKRKRTLAAIAAFVSASQSARTRHDLRISA